jgi:HEAT repeat protein
LVIRLTTNGIPTKKLIATCERHWEWLEQPRDIEIDFTRKEQKRYNDYKLAVNALGSRGPAVRDWARKLLAHPDYLARETGAWLLGELGERGELGDATGAVIVELAGVINRPFEEDPPKEATAIDLALAALGKIGDPRAIAVIREVLFSSKREHEGDTQWEAAGALENLVGEPFSESEDRVEAARSWLRANPNR